MLEMDLRQSSDGALIVLHDRRVDRTTNGQGAADSLTPRPIEAARRWLPLQLRRPNLSLSRPRGRNPHLRRGLYSFSQHALSHRNQKRLRRVSKRLLPHNPALRAKRPRHRRLVPQPPFRDLAPVFAPKWQLQLLHRQECPLSFSTGCGSTRPYHPVSQAFQVPARLGKIDLIDQRFVARAHAHNIQVHIWTINNLNAMQHYLDLGVDGLITDYPDRLLRILNRQPAEETSWATQ